MLNTTICIYVFCVFYCNLIVQSSQALKPFVTKTRFVFEIGCSTILQKVRFCGSFFVPPHMAETQARHLRGILRMPSQCTLARFGTSRASPSPNGARCKAAHISAMQEKPFLVQVVLGFSFSVGLSQRPFRSRRAACLFNHPPQCHKMSN